MTETKNKVTANANVLAHGEVLARLEKVIAARKRKGEVGASYVAGLLRGDEDALLKKIVEEAGEAALAAKGKKRARLVEEMADLWFHCLIVLARYNAEVDEVLAALAAREGRGGLAEKAARKKKAKRAKN